MEEAAADGDLQGVMRAWDVPGVDTLVENGRSPSHFKAVASVAHFRKTRFTCENQGLHGWESTIDFQKMRLGWQGRDYQDLTWSRQWLSRERDEVTLRTLPRQPCLPDGCAPGDSGHTRPLHQSF